MKLEKNLLSEEIVTNIMEFVDDYCEEKISIILKRISEEDIACPPAISKSIELLSPSIGRSEELKTNFLRSEFMKSHFDYVDPVPVFVGNDPISKNPSYLYYFDVQSMVTFSTYVTPFITRHFLRVWIRQRIRFF